MNSPEECLILFVDDDQILSNAIGKYLSSIGFRVALALNGKQGLEMFNELRPQLVIADLNMPVMGGMEFLEETRKSDSVTPIIVTTGYPEVETAIKAIQHGAFDYLIKPFQLELLHQKIRQAIKTNRLVRENAALSELVSLHEITSRLTNTHDLDRLLDITFQYCQTISGAQSAAIQIIDKKKEILVVVRQKGMEYPQRISPLADTTEWPHEKWVVKTGKPLLIAPDVVNEDNTAPTGNGDGCSSLTVPLRVAEEVVGVVTLKRFNSDEPFSLVDLNIINVLASQAGIAINNAHLYDSVNQKLEELSLISTYSEQLMGLIDKYDIISCLFETVRKYFTIDIMGFLVVAKRDHGFLYWERGEVADDFKEKIRLDVVDFYNTTAREQISPKRVTLEHLKLSIAEKTPVSLPLGFKSIMPVAWEDCDYGAVYFGAQKELENKDEKVVLLSSLVNQTRIALTNSKLYGDMKENYIRTIKALAIAVDAKDTFTHGHSENVMNIAEGIAVEMKMEGKLIGIVRDAGLLHDIGKIGVPGNILNKPGPLNNEEFNGIMKTHSTLGANIVKDVPFLQDLYSLILYHHEHYDGTGYPEGLRGEAIPLGARIIHVADAFEAMTSNRPYRKSLGNKEAFKRLDANRGKQFDPKVVSAFFVVAKKKGWLTEEDTH